MFSKIQSFFVKNRVFFTGLVSAVFIGLQGVNASDIDNLDLKMAGLAVFYAVLSFIANEWRGKGLTVLGILGTAAGVVVSLQQTHTLTTQQFILTLLGAFGFAAMPNPKPASYEQAPTIVEAKKNSA